MTTRRRDCNESRVDSPQPLPSLAKRIQFRIEYALVRAVAALIVALGLERSSAVSGALWRVIAPWTPRHRRADANLAQAMPHLDAAGRRATLNAMWDNLGRTFAEFFHLKGLLDGGRLELEDPSAFAALAGRPGLVACAPHLGNWETLGAYALQQGASIAGVYKEMSNPLVEEYVRTLRAPFYPAGLFPKSALAARRLVKQARAGGIVAFLADQRDGRGVMSPFFGREAPSTPFPAFVARSLDLPLCALRVLRLPGPRFRLRIEEVPVPRTHDRDADVRTATAALQARFEAYVREAPGQWMWAHKRWG